MRYLSSVLARLFPKERLVKLPLPGSSRTAKPTLGGTNTLVGFQSGSESISTAGETNICQRDDKHICNTRQLILCKYKDLANVSFFEGVGISLVERLRT